MIEEKTLSQTVALRLIIAGCLLGLAGDWLLNGSAWGLGGSIFATIVMVAALVTTSGWRDRRILLVATTLTAFGWLLIWRDSPTLRAFDILAALVCSALLTFPMRGLAYSLAGLLHYFCVMALTGIESLLGPFRLLFAEFPSSLLPRGKFMTRSVPVARGALLALPVIAVLGALLMSADAAFEALVRKLFDIDLDLGTIFSHVGVIIFIAGLSAGFLRTLVQPFKFPTSIGRSSFLRLGAVEASVVLGAVDLLFASFVAVQFRYFFGGASLVQLTPGLTWADYARRGFFELATVAALVLPMLLALDWLVSGDDPRTLRLFRALAAAQVLLLLPILASALERMQLYRAEFGLTEFRVYTTAFIFWLGVVLLWFLVTVLRGHRLRFPLGALTAAFVALLVLHIVNPDDAIVRVNSLRAREGKRKLDTSYLLTLSADSVPALLANLDLVTPAEAQQTANHLRSWRTREARRDWRSWNLSRSRAAGTIDASRELPPLRIVVRPPTPSVPGR